MPGQIIERKFFFLSFGAPSKDDRGKKREHNRGTRITPRERFEFRGQAIYPTTHAFVYYSLLLARSVSPRYPLLAFVNEHCLARFRGNSIPFVVHRYVEYSYSLLALSLSPAAGSAKVVDCARWFARSARPCIIEALGQRRGREREGVSYFPRGGVGREEGEEG